MEISQEKIEEIISVLDSTADMMEPYYKQCNGMDEALSLIEELKNMLPYVHVTTETFPAFCKICNKTFIKSNRGNLLDPNGQDSAASNHVLSEHGIQDYKERKKQIQRCIVKTTRIEYKTKAEFLASR